MYLIINKRQIAILDYIVNIYVYIYIIFMIQIYKFRFNISGSVKNLYIT